MKRTSTFPCQVLDYLNALFTKQNRISGFQSSFFSFSIILDLETDRKYLNI